MKKLLLIAILMLALVFTIVACTETPAGSDTTAADTTAETPTAAPTEEATTEAPTEEEPTEEVTTEEPTAAPTEEPTAAPTEEPTEPPTADPADPVWIVDPDAIAGSTSGAAAAYIAGAEVMEEDGYKFVRITVNGGDSQFMVVRDLGTMPNYLAISYRVNSDIDGEMFIGTANGPNGQNDHAALDWNNDNTWSLMIVDLSTIANVADGNIGYFRLDPFRNTTDGNIDIEYIALFNTAEYAMAYNFELHKAPMWNETKAVISHQSFDELDKYADGAKVEGVFTPGQSAGWDMVITLDDFSVDAIRYWGWIAGVTEQGLFGYQINGGPAIYDEAWTHPEDLMAHAPAGSTYTTRMKIMISLEGLVGENTIRALYKDAAGTEVCLNEFTVVLPARAPFEVPEHMDETINLGTGNGDPYGAEKKFGQRYNIGENFLKQITVTNMASYADGNTNKWSVKIWAWNTDYATTTAAEPLFVLNGENHQDCSSFVVDVPAELGIMGDFYYEVEYLEGSAQFTGWTAANVAEGVETYANGNLKAGSYASSIVVGVAIPEGATITVIDLSAVTSTGSYPTVDNPIPGSLFGAAHCYALHYGSINLGEMDLSKYSKVTITYSTPDDATVPTASAEYNMTGKRVLLLNAPSAAEGTFEYLPEESAIITSTQYELSPASLIPTTVEIDLSEITYNGDVYLTFDFRNPNNEIAVNAYVVWLIDITFS